MRLQKNQTLTAHLTETNMLGFGIAKIDGAVIFVQNGVKGDEAKLRIIKCAKNYYIARIEELIAPSPERTEPKCPHYRRCGGCSFQHIRYEHEKELKRAYIENCFRKVGISNITVLPLLSTDKTSEYRNKAQFPLSLDSEGKVVCGFYSAKTHRVCPIDRCDIQNPSFSEIALFVCRYLTEYKIPPYTEEDQSGLVRHIYLRIAEATGEIMLCLVLKEDCFPHEDRFVRSVVSAFPKVKTISFNIQPNNSNVILGKDTRTLFGSEKIVDILCGKKLMISPQSFYQVNHDAAELLYQTAFKMAKIHQFDHIVDLFCGIGSISLAASHAAPISGVEIIPEAVRDAAANAGINGVTNAHFYCGDAADAFRIIKEKEAKNPLIIVDPPRKGLSEKLIQDIAHQKIQNVLYISCGPDSLARDVAKFCELGYTFGPVQPVDLFPRTGHVETVALLSRQIDMHKMKLNSAPFEMIRSGEKTIELRLYDEKRQQVKVGDKIVFTNTTTGETLNTTVVKLHRFNSFEELYKSLPLLQCGYTTENVDKAKPADMEQYYSVDEQKKYGVVGIELCRPEKITDEMVALFSRQKVDEHIYFDADL